MEQSAVEWLVDKVIEYQQKGLKISKTLDKLVIQQAKEMEKQQIIDAHLCGLIYPLESEASKQAEQYYNETFNKPTL
jgi:hypothetical protein